MKRSPKDLVRPLVPHRLRVMLRSLLERETVSQGDVERVKAITANQWRTLGQRSPRYLPSYWDDADDDARDTLGKRRSAWLADLLEFRQVQSVMELGCAAGRNLYFLKQRDPALALYGVDISPEGISHARRYVRGEFVVGDLYDLGTVLGERVVDLIFTMGVLIHLHPQTLAGVIGEMRRHARKYLIFVEQVSRENEVVKGPARWGPHRRITGDYIQWSPNLSKILADLGIPHRLSEVPPPLQSNGARHLIVATP